MINSVLLAFIDYSPNSEPTLGHLIVTKSEPVFTILYTIEALIKIIAMGLFFD